MSDKKRPSLLITDRQRAVFQILADAGIRESGTDPDGTEYDGTPPEGLTLMVDMALDGQATADDVLGVITWGRRELVTPALQAVAKRIAAIRDNSPA